VVDAPAEREQLLAYLRGGALVPATTATMGDIVNPAAGAVVPGTFRTDGEWIWTDTASTTSAGTAWPWTAGWTSTSAASWPMVRPCPWWMPRPRAGPPTSC
jgi:hypothetical protein